MQNTTSRINQLWFLTLLLLLFFALATAWLDKPFTGHHDWDNVLYTHAVRNYLKFGYSDLGYIQVYSPLKSLPDDLDRSGAYVYRHNPPTLAILQSLSVRAFADSEAFIRLPNIIITLFSITIIYQLSKAMYGRRTAVRVTFFFAFAPLVVYFSRAVNHEAGNIFFVNAMLLAYLHWTRKKQPSSLAIAHMLAFAGLWFGHFMAFFLVFFFIYGLIWGTREEKIAIFTICLAGFVGFATWITYTTKGFDSYILEEFEEIFTQRTSTSAGDSATVESFNTLDYLGRMLLRISYGFSFFGFLFALFGIYSLYKQGMKRQDYLIWAHLIAGLVYTTLWRNATWIHDYFTYYVVAPLAIWAGYGLHIVWPHGSTKPRNRPQLYAWGGLIGHVVLVMAVSVVLIALSNRSFLTVADLVAERTTEDERIATNLPYRGPHIEFYAERTISFDVKFDVNRLDEVFTTRGYDFYLVCNLREAPNWPPQVTVEEAKSCYAVRPR